MLAVKADGKVHAVIKRVCESLGVDLRTQLRKLKPHAWALMVNLTINDALGRPRETACIPLRALSYQ